MPRTAKARAAKSDLPGLKRKTAKKPKAHKDNAALKPQAKSRRKLAFTNIGGDRIERLAIALAEIASGFRIGSPRTARLLSAGPPKMAQKLIEEAAEAGIEAVRGDIPALIRESADLIYNMVALWTVLGVGPEDVWHEMDQREITLGLAEKLPKTGERD